MLVIGTSVDPHIDAVLDRLPEGMEVCRLDVDRFPVAQRLTVLPGTGLRVRLDEPLGSWRLDGCRIAWFRRLGQPGLDKRVQGAQRAFALGEVEQTLTGALDLVEPGRWINPYWAARRAAIKLWQYQVIERLGIPFASVVVSNDASVIREWAGHIPVVYKTLHSPLMEITDDDKARGFVFTSAVSPKDLSDSEAIALAPCQFQQHVTAVYELRVTTIGKQHIAVRIDHEPWDSHDAQDWRAYPERLTYASYDLPETVAMQVDALMDALGLQFGASDWMVEEGGRHVLLETNPHGAWLWLEREVDGLGITEKIARELVR